MKAQYILVVVIFLAVNCLWSLGYRSGFVDTERAIVNEYIADDLESLEGLELPPNAKSMEFGTSKAVSFKSQYVEAAPSFTNAQTTQLAMPALDPVTETTTKLVYGLMDTILLRFKQQLFITSVNQWQDELLESDFQYLFPNLVKVVRSTDANTFMSSYGLWKASIERDMQETPLNLIDYTLRTLEAREFITLEERSLLTELKNLLGDIYTYRNISNLDEFIQVSSSPETQHSQLFKLIGIITKNMLDENGDIILDDIKVLSKDPEWLKVYIANIQADYRDLRLNDSSFRITEANFKHYLSASATVKSFVDQLSADAANSETGRMSISDYMRLFMTTCDKLIINWSNLTTNQHSDWNKYYRLFSQYRYQIMDLSLMIREKQYKPLLNTMITTSLNIAADHGYMPMSYSRFMSLISAIALTGDSGEVNYRQLMDSVLEPVGSYAYKRESDFTVLINSYPGLGGGAESLSTDLKDPKAVAGLSCPIGIELNWGNSILGMRGVFLSAFDIGAVASYRFTEEGDTDSSSPQIGWKQLVSPGLYVLLQRKDNPITLGLGMQMTPQLRKITEDGMVKEKNALRLGGFVSMDIPLFTFYVKHNWLKPMGSKTAKL